MTGTNETTAGAVLVTGGAGYIGSHVVHLLHDQGIPAVVVDDLSAGHAELLPDGVPLSQGDIGDQDLIRGLCREHGVSAILHFAGSIKVPESVEKPLDYYANNTAKSRDLIEAAVAEGVPHFIYSSSASVYGCSENPVVDETAPTVPASPYGASKLMTEWMLRDAAAAHGFNYVALRYFNVAGADPEGRTGQIAEDATHLIKRVVETALGKRKELTVYGDDYDTPDGTCLRDFIHVSDLAAAHLAALNYLTGGGMSAVLNCGYGHGASVRQVIEAAGVVTGKDIPFSVGPRRAGDAPALIADPGRIKKVLGWEPRLDDLKTIIRSTIDWETRE